MRKKHIVLIIAALVLLADQISKFFIVRDFLPYESVPVITNVFHITYVMNTGMAFSMFTSYGRVLAVFAFIVICFLFIYVYRQKDEILGETFVALSFIIGGALGNLVDRVFRGAVVDFLDFRIWPVFNVADSALSVGIFLLLLHSIMRRKYGSKAGSQ